MAFIAITSIVAHIIVTMIKAMVTWGEEGVEGDNLLLAKFLIIESSESAEEILFNFLWPPCAFVC